MRRQRTGEGASIDLSQIETAVYSQAEVVLRFSATGEVVTRNANRHERTAPHGIYPCEGEDRWIAIATWSEQEWEALVHEMGNPAWASQLASRGARLAKQDELDTRIAQWCRDLEPHGLAVRLQNAGVEAGVVQTFDDLLSDPQLHHRSH